MMLLHNEARGEEHLNNAVHENTHCRHSGLHQRDTDKESRRLKFLARNMSKILRHTAIDLKLPFTPYGYVPVSNLLDLPQLQSFTFDDVQNVVTRDEKGRFKLQRCFFTEEWLVRANYGHTIPCADLSLQKLQVTTDTVYAAHATMNTSFPIKNSLETRNT